MIRSRINPNQPNTDHLRPLDGPTLPSGWVRAAASELDGRPSDERAYVLLLGAADLIGFRVRVAQSQVRSDALPSFFSSAALLFVNGTGAEIVHVPLVGREPPGSVPRRNGIETSPLATLDERTNLYPNLALLSLPVDDVSDLRATVETLRSARLSYDFVSAIPCWLGYAWGAHKAENPLRNGIGLPSASFVEACYASCRVDVAPGLNERVLSPEVIWQGMKWWANSYDGKATARYRLFQPEAAATVDA